MKNKKLILFDLDGVLIDSKKNMQIAWESVCHQHNINTEFEEYFMNIGRPFQDILHILGIDKDQQIIEKSFKSASLKYLDKVVFYDNVESVLQELVNNKLKIGIVTSKDLARTKIILSKLSNSFSVIRTPDDTFRGKPSPDHLLQAISISNEDPDNTLYIGDMLVDYQASLRAKIDYAHAKWGYQNNSESGIIKLNNMIDLKTLLLN
jgi:phosphoglycolate phosphatase